MSTLVTTAPTGPAMTAATPRAAWWSLWRTGLVVLGILTAILTAWGVWSGSRSDYYAAIAVSMSQNWSNFFFGAFDPAGTVTLDKIPGSFWVPALFVKIFGFSDWAVILPNALAGVGATLTVAVTAKRLLNPLAGMIAGAVVASTPILIAVSRSNQPESFFVLGLALTAWAATRAVQRRSVGWLILAGLFVALSFQTYMLEAWAVWPAMAGAYLCTRQPWGRRLWHTAVAGGISLALSVVWIVIVALIPAANRPYIGSTLHNDPWEMVFGYNGLGRFGTDTADAEAYRSFTPPFSGSAGAFRLFNEQVAGQVAWLIPTAIIAIVILALLRFSLPLTVFLGVWLVTFLGMFSAVAGMHQFYTAALAVPIALSIGVAFAHARARRVFWAQTALVAGAGVTAVAIGLAYGGYSLVVAVVQLALGAVVVGVLMWERHRGTPVRFWTALLTICALTLTPAVWSVVSMWNPSSVNPVAGGVSDLDFGGRGGFGGRQQGGGPAGQGGGQVAPGAGQSGPGRGQGGPGGAAARQGAPGGALGFAGAQGAGTGLSSATLAWLEQHRGDARYLIAAFGAQAAAGIILDSGGESVLPIGGFNSADPVPSLETFESMTTSGAVRYVYAPDLIGAGASTSGATSSSEQIRAWVAQNCTVVTDVAGTGIYDCGP